MPPKKQKVTMYAQGDLLEPPVAVDEDSLPAPPVLKEKKPRTEKQIAATAKLLALNIERKKVRDAEKELASHQPAPPTPPNTPVEVAPDAGEAPKPKRKRKPKVVAAPDPVAEEGEPVPPSALEVMPETPEVVEEPKPKRVKKNPKVKGAVSLNSIAKAPSKPNVPSETNLEFMLKKFDEQNAKLDQMFAEKELKKKQKDEFLTNEKKVKSAGIQSWDERNDHFKNEITDKVNTYFSSIFKK